MISKNETMSIKKKLFNNTIIFAVANISTKIIQFILIPLYTFYLTTTEYGIIDLINSFSLFVVPIISLGIIESTFRFSMDKSIDKKNVFTFSFLFLLFSLILIPMYKVFEINDIFRGYGIFIALIIISELGKSICLQFIRGINEIKKYVFLGCLCTSLFCLLNIFFIVFLKWKIYGYLLSIIVSNFVIMFFSLTIFKLYKYFSFKNFDKILIKKMLSFSIPLVFNTLSWVIISSSDKFIIEYVLGPSQNGIFSLANKIPSLITTIYGVFLNAWVISAIDEYENDYASIIFSSVFNKLFSILTIVCSGIILVINLYFELFVANEYSSANLYVPLLCIGIILYCQSSNLGVIYTSFKKNFSCMLGVVIAAIINVFSHIILIKYIGLYAAGVSTILSYLFILIFRIIDTRRFLKINYSFIIQIISLLLLSCQFFIHIIFSDVMCYLLKSFIFILIVFINRNVIKDVIILFKRKVIKKNEKN